MNKQVTSADLELARSDDADLWFVGNETLYRLCAQRPFHFCAKDSIAKLWLIGRSYSAAIERRRTAHETKKREVDEYYEEVAHSLAESDIDKVIACVPRETPTSMAGFAPALEAHARLVDILHKHSGSELRSFSSKYLHFHVPNAFFIFDSIVSLGLKRLGNERLLPGPPVDGVGEPEYCRFVSKVLALRSELASTNSPPLTPRQIDRLLLRFGRKRFDKDAAMDLGDDGLRGHPVVNCPNTKFF